jgi:aminopeptidase YwaD
MLQRNLTLFREAVSGAAALQDLAGIIAHHRIQSSPGYRQAAHFCLGRLREAGLAADIFSFPGDGVTEFWGYPIPQEWTAQSATLRLVAPEKEARILADFRDVKIALIQRSLATPEGGVEAEVVVLEDGEEEDEYKGLDLKGKVVLTRGDIGRVRELAVQQHGAVGILYDGMRESPPVRPLLGLPDARQYTSFWWEDAAEEIPTRCFGFVLTPQQGEWLRRLVRAEAREDRTVRVHAEVDASAYAGHGEDVEALIPGETAEEVWLVAHLCHPQPSANDNASGAATLLETARALARLVETGKLPKPRRGLRFLLVPEMTGTYAYLAGHEDLIPNVVAALNLDMVGEDQAQTGSTLLLTGAPLSTPTVSDDLLVLIMQFLSCDAKDLMGSSEYALFRWTETPFSGGSDHYILTDPTVGIPCPMLLQWPDKFYHTSADTIDKVDPDMLARVGAAAAAYLWWFATAGPREAAWLGPAVVSRSAAALGRVRQSWLDELLARDPVPTPDELAKALHALRRRLRMRVEQRVASLALLQRLAGRDLTQLPDWQAQVDAAGERELQRAWAALADLFSLAELPPLPEAPLDEWDERAAAMVPRRLTRGPISIRNRRGRLSPEDREAWRKLQKEHGRWGGTLLAVYWTDGRRTLLEIADLVEDECGQRTVEGLVRYYELLAKMGLVEIGTRP